MVNIQELDPNGSPLDYYGWELRRRREAHTLTQQQLGDVIFCTGGTFSRPIGLVLRSRLPSWFQPVAELEARATYISTFQTQVVYGLLQTPEYARALLAVEYPDKAEEVTAGTPARPGARRAARPVGRPERGRAEAGGGRPRGHARAVGTPADVPRQLVGPDPGAAVRRRRAHGAESSYSGTNGGECIEVADGFPGAVPVRDSKNPSGPALVVAPGAWQTFVDGLR